jgi:hypothetical protein
MQDFEGAADLDILPALNGKAVQGARVWCAAGSPLRVQLTADMHGFTDATAILLGLIAPDGSVLAQQSCTKTSPGNALTATTRVTGFHACRLTASNTPPGNLNPLYTLSVTYTAPPTFELSAS